MPRQDQAITVGAHQMITPAGSIQDAIQQFNLYQELKTKLATDDDFQPIAGKKHPKKSFVRKVQRFFNLSCELLRDEPLYDSNGKLIAWLATARAVHAPTGAYQDADGSCSFEEKSGNQKTVHNIRAHAITRAKNRAILDLVGFGDVSAEEILADDNHDQPGPRSQTAKNGTKITQPQLSKIHALLNELQATEEDIAALKEKFGVQSWKDLSKKSASKLIDALEKRKQRQTQEQPAEMADQEIPDPTDEELAQLQMGQT